MFESSLILGGSRRGGSIQTDRDYERTQPIIIQIALPYTEGNDRATAGFTCGQFCEKIQDALTAANVNLTSTVTVTRNPNWRKL